MVSATLPGILEVPAEQEVVAMAVVAAADQQAPLFQQTETGILAAQEAVPKEAVAVVQEALLPQMALTVTVLLVARAVMAELVIRVLPAAMAQQRLPMEALVQRLEPEAAAETKLLLQAVLMAAMALLASNSVLPLVRVAEAEAQETQAQKEAPEANMVAVEEVAQPVPLPVIVKALAV